MDDFAHARLAEDEPKNPFDLKVLVFYGLVRFRKQIIGLGIVGGLLGLIAGASQPNVYSVTAKLRYGASARQAVSGEIAYGLEMLEYRGVASGAILEEIELLRDPVIYERVVDKFGPEDILTVADPRSGDGPSTSPVVKFMHSLQSGLIHLKGLDDPCPDGPTQEARDAAVARLRANTTIKDVRRTYLIAVTYTDSSPAKAKLIGDEIVHQMRMRHLQQFAVTRDLEVLQVNKKDVQQEFKLRDQEWSEFKQQCGFHDLEADFQACQEDIRENEKRSQQLELDRQRLLGMVRSLEDQLNPRRGGEPTDDVEGAQGSRSINPEYVILLGDIRKVNTEIRNIDKEVTPGTLSLGKRAKLVAQREKLEEILADTDQYGQQSTLHALTSETNDAITEMQALLASSRADLDGIIKQLETAREQLEGYNERRRAMQGCWAEHMRLKADVETVELRLDRITASERTLSSLAIMDSEESSNLSEYLSPRLPKDKDGPQRSKPLMMGFAAGLALGIGLAILRQLLDRKVRYQETIENSLGLRVLCVLPELSGKSGSRGAKGAA